MGLRGCGNGKMKGISSEAQEELNEGQRYLGFLTIYIEWTEQGAVIHEVLFLRIFETGEYADI
jgi:hypothetical protein